jgi:hypothetical protein
MISASDLISKSFRLYKNNFVTFLKYIGLILLVQIVTALIIFAAGAGTFFSFFMGSAGNTNGVLSAIGGSSLIIPLVALLAGIIASLLFYWVQISLIKEVSLVAEDHHKTLSEIFSDTKSVFWRSIGVTIMVAIYVGWPYLALGILAAILGASGTMGIVYFILMLASIIYSIYYIVKLFFSFLHVVIAESGIMKAIDYSKEKVSGNWWSVLWRIIASIIAFAVISLLAQIIFSVVLPALDNAVIAAISMFLGALVQLLITPLYSIAQVLLYKDVA